MFNFFFQLRNHFLWLLVSKCTFVSSGFMVLYKPLINAFFIPLILVSGFRIIKMGPLVLWVEKVKGFWNGRNRLVEFLKINQWKRQALLIGEGAHTYSYGERSELIEGPEPWNSEIPVGSLGEQESFEEARRGGERLAKLTAQVQGFLRNLQASLNPAIQQNDITAADGNVAEALGLFLMNSKLQVETQKDIWFARNRRLMLPGGDSRTQQELLLGRRRNSKPESTDYAIRTFVNCELNLLDNQKLCIIIGEMFLRDYQESSNAN